MFQRLMNRLQGLGENTWLMAALLLLWLLFSFLSGHPGYGLAYLLGFVLAVLLTLPVWGIPAAMVWALLVLWMERRHERQAGGKR